MLSVGGDDNGGYTMDDVRQLIPAEAKAFVDDILKRYEVPELTGKTLDTAKAALAERNLALGGTSEQWHESVAAGEIISTAPKPGTELKRGQELVVYVSRGHEPVAVPAVVGLSPEEATANLEALEFTVERTEGRSADVAPGEVMAVSPAAGQQAPHESTVTLQVSVGLPQVQVPDVVGRTQAEATSLLQQAGLKVQVSEFFGERVLRQAPAAGQTVEIGTPVTILVSFGQD